MLCLILPAHPSTMPNDTPVSAPHAHTRSVAAGFPDSRMSSTKLRNASSTSTRQNWTLKPTSMSVRTILLLRTGATERLAASTD